QRSSQVLGVYKKVRRNIMLFLQSHGIGTFLTFRPSWSSSWKKEKGDGSRTGVFSHFHLLLKPRARPVDQSDLAVAQRGTAASLWKMRFSAAMRVTTPTTSKNETYFP